jgi:AcrR family transcriptional regulator
MNMSVSKSKVVRRPKAEGRSRVVVESRRGEILAAATKVFGSKGFNDTRMEDIARAAKLAKGTLYLYFRSKDEIYLATVQSALTELHSLTQTLVGSEPTLAGKLEAFIRVRNEYWQRQQPLFRLILSLSKEGAHRKHAIAWQRQIVMYLAETFAEAARAGEIPEQDFTAVAWTTMDSIRGVCERRAFAEGRIAEEDTRFLTDFLMAGLKGYPPIPIPPR